MERREFLKIALGVVAGAAAMAASAQAAPLAPQPLVPDGWLPANQDAIPPSRQATKSIVSHLKKCAGATAIMAAGAMAAHRGWGHRHWGWHRRHWGWRRRHWGWHRRRYWRRRYWRRRYY